MTVRSATADDAGSVWSLAVELATSARPTPEGFARMYRTMLEHPGCLLLVAEAVPGGRVMGYLSASIRPTFHADGPVAWVDEIVVEVEMRRSGAGAALMGAAETWAQEAGARVVSLATRRARPFYVALGYAASATYYKKALRHPGQ